MKIAGRIKQLIENQNMSNSEFCDKVGVDRTTIAHMIRNDSYPRSNILEGIAVAFPTLNLRWLLTGEGEMWKDYLMTIEPEDGEEELSLEEQAAHYKFMMERYKKQSDRLKSELDTLISFIEQLQERINNDF